jgi:hypothetical protein
MGKGRGSRRSAEQREQRQRREERALDGVPPGAESVWGRSADEARATLRRWLSGACSHQGQPGAVEPADEAGFARVGLP